MAEPSKRLVVSGGSRLDLRGRVVAVAGAGGGGIGTATSALAAASGAVVVGFDTSAEGRATAAAAVADAGGEALVLDVDVTSTSALEEALRLVEGRFGPVDGLVNVVGGMRGHHWAALVDVTDEVVDELLHANLRAPLTTSQVVVRRLLAHGRGGSIVHVSSVAGLTGMPYGALYGAAKAAVANLTRSMAVEWGPAGIRVNAVAPGTIVTPKPGRERVDGGEAPSESELAAIPLRRRGTPADVAAVAGFLLSDLAAYVTGQVVVVDGGLLARPSFTDADDLPVFVRDPGLRTRLGKGQP